MRLTAVAGAWPASAMLSSARRLGACRGGAHAGAAPARSAASARSCSPTSTSSTGRGPTASPCVPRRRAARRRPRPARPGSARDRLAPGLRLGRTRYRGLAEEQHADLVTMRFKRSRRRPDHTALRLPGRPLRRLDQRRRTARHSAFHHVGIAYDGTPESSAALRTAYALAARDGAAVTLYHAVAGVAAAQSGASNRELERAALAPRLEAQQLLDTAADGAPPGVNPRTVLLHGDPGPKIGAAARRHPRHPLRRLARLRSDAPRARRQRVRVAAEVVHASGRRDTARGCRRCPVTEPIGTIARSRVSSRKLSAGSQRPAILRRDPGTMNMTTARSRTTTAGSRRPAGLISRRRAVGLLAGGIGSATWRLRLVREELDRRPARPRRRPLRRCDRDPGRDRRPVPRGRIQRAERTHRERRRAARHHEELRRHLGQADGVPTRSR